MLSHLLSATTFFVPAQTLARIDYLWSGGRLVDKSGTHDVKIFAEKWTKGALAS